MKKNKGFTLIELLIVVAIIGIIAAIAIPNLLDAIERSRQKSTMSDITNLATALQNFSTDFQGYPNNTHNGDPFTTFGGVDGAGWQSTGTVPGNVFVPDYTQAVPMADGWKSPYNYQADPDRTVPLTPNDPLGQQRAIHFTLWSMGNDGANSAATTDAGATDGQTIAASWNQLAPVVSGTRDTHCYMTDIVWCDASFMQRPEGKQKNCQ